MPFKTVLIFCFLACCVNAMGQGENQNIVKTPSAEKRFLKVGLKESPPFTYKDEAGKYTGLSVFLWSAIADSLGVEYEFVDLDLAQILEKLGTSEIDLAINPLTVTSDRIKSISFTQPFFISNSVIVTKEEQTNNVMTIIMTMFSYNFLRALFLLIIVLISFGTVMWFIERKKNDQFSNGLEGWWTGIWWSAATMTTVGYGDTTPKTAVGKMIGMILMFVAMMVVSGLMAGIASALTIEQMGDDWDHVQDLREAKVGSIPSSSSDYYLEHHRIRSKDFKNIEAGLDAVIANKIDAFVYDEPILRWEIEHNEKDDVLKILPFKLNKQYYAFGMPKGDTLIQKMNPFLIELLESPQWKNELSHYNLSGL